MDLPNDAHTDIARVIEYYQSVLPRRSLPGTRHFDPMSTEIRNDMADRMVLMEVRRKPWVFVTRYAGAYIEDFAGEHLKGRQFAERLSGEGRLQVERNLIKVAQSGRPSWRRGRPLIRHETSNTELERVLLPLSLSGKTVDLLLSVTVHCERKEPRVVERIPLPPL